MSLPGLDFNKWELINPPKSVIDEKSNIPNNIRNELDNVKIINDSGGTDIKHNKTCLKCTEMNNNFLKRLQKTKTEIVNNNESENGALCCKCSKQHANNFESKITATSTKTETITNVELIKSIPQRRNLSLKRQNSKEVQTRALISRVAEYYESYVTEMGLENNFLNNAIVTTVSPLRQCQQQSQPQQGKEFQERIKDARWIVCG